jgi:hypothetical protein
MAQGSKIVTGLSLKPAKKKPVLNSSLAADSSDADAVPVDYIKGVAEKTFASTAEAPGAKPVFVIPLTTNPWKSADDAEAVAAILAGVHAPAEAEGPTIAAIPMLAPAGGTDSRGAAEPLLKAAMIPGLVDLHDDDAKFKHDLAMRAANIDAKSECYASVPISAFGEALLRGMGWDGARSDAEQAESQARPKRLGLGAKVRPPSPPAKQRTRKPGEQKAFEDSTWAKEAARKVAAQKLNPGDVVWLRDPRFVKKDGVVRAQVTRTSGVPGLNAVEVALEDSGERVTLNRNHAIAVPSDELDAKPFRAARKRDRHDDKAPSDKAPKKARDDASTREWILPAIRVRILEKGRFQGLKGDISDVRDGRATVIVDDGTAAGAFSPRNLETVVPSVGDAVVVLRGPLRARRGPILTKDRDREEVCLELDGRREYFRFDHVSAAASRPPR